MVETQKKKNQKKKTKKKTKKQAQIVTGLQQFFFKTIPNSDLSNHSVHPQWLLKQWTDGSLERENKRRLKTGCLFYLSQIDLWHLVTVFSMSTGW